MRIRSLPLLLLGSLVAVPLLADDVYLVNGRKFEGVIAETAGSQVRIRMQGGTLSLPKEQVLRVDAGDSNLAEYLRRKDLLKKNPSTRAADWLELSRWAHGRELDQAARESALAAATLDPKLEGLGPVLRGYGYVLDPQLDRWIPYADSMRRRGFVQSNGQWISREEYQARLQAQEERAARYYAARQEAARAAREDRLAALAELSVVRQLAQPAEPPNPYSIYGAPYYGYGTVVVSPSFGGGGHHRPPHGQAGPAGFTHIPGSLIPGSLFPESN
ncbi:MAG TPA: hypothetical protein VLR69_21640 [Thermoanaerobaculia bacterium]|nr:hypothetical protein [Thermoanaerobaculia bacterium]